MTVIYAGFGQRFVAVFLDGLIIGGVCAVIMAIFGAIIFAIITAGGATRSVSDTTGGVVILITALEYLLIFLLAMGYQIYFIGKNGQTLGKKALGIKVIKLDGTPVTYKTAVRRELLGKFVSGLIPLAMGYFWMLWDKDKQALHDKIAGTVVVKI